MKVKLIDKLEKNRDTSIDVVSQIENNLSTGAKQLLLDTSKDEQMVLRKAGLATNIIEIENARGKNMDRQKFEDTFGQKVFTTEEVKDLCYKYALKLLKSNLYKGGIDPVLGEKIVQFFKKAGIDNIGYEAGENLYIMAPAKMFDLTTKTNPFTFKVDIDPVLFYKIHNKNGEAMYIPIHKWGKDFTVFRRLVGAVKFNYWTNSVFSVAYKAALFLMIFAIFKVNPTHIVPILIACGLGLICHYLYYYNSYSGRNGDDDIVEESKHLFSQHGWRSEFK